MPADAAHRVLVVNHAAITGEMLVGTVRVLMADEISTGLDSATTFSIVARLKSFMAMRPTFLVR